MEKARGRERESLVYKLVPIQAAYFWYTMLPTVSVHYTLTQQHFKPYLTEQIDKLSTDSFFHKQEHTYIVHIQTGSCPVKPVHSLLRAVKAQRCDVTHKLPSTVTRQIVSWVLCSTRKLGCLVYALKNSLKFKAESNFQSHLHKINFSGAVCHKAQGLMPVRIC